MNGLDRYLDDNEKYSLPKSHFITFNRYKNETKEIDNYKLLGSMQDDEHFRNDSLKNLNKEKESIFTKSKVQPYLPIGFQLLFTLSKITIYLFKIR